MDRDYLHMLAVALVLIVIVSVISLYRYYVEAEFFGSYDQPTVTTVVGNEEIRGESLGPIGVNFWIQ